MILGIAAIQVLNRSILGLRSLVEKTNNLISKSNYQVIIKLKNNILSNHFIEFFIYILCCSFHQWPA